MRDLYNQIEVRRAISPVSVTDNTAQASQIIDTRGFESLTFVINIGSVADADATFAVTMTHGDASDLSDGTAVTSTELLGTLALAGFQFDSDNTMRKIGYLGGKRYVRLTITPSGNSGAALIASTAILGHPAYAPTV